jgi:hypothetical protein
MVPLPDEDKGLEQADANRQSAQAPNICISLLKRQILNDFSHIKAKVYKPALFKSQ